MDERTERIGLNEALFRSVNERVKRVNEAFRIVLDHSTFVCECGRPDCVEPLRLTLEEYERVRDDSRLFAIVPGHDEPAVEVVVAENDRFTVVRKREGGPTELAARLDPRA